MTEESKPASDPMARRPSPQRPSAVAEDLAQLDRHTPMDSVVRRRQQSYGHTSGFMDSGAPRNNNSNSDMMGPLLRRKKVVSLPLGGHGNDLFFGDAPPRQDNISSGSNSPDRKPQPQHKREESWPPGQRRPQRKKTNSFMDNMIRRKQVSLDLYAPGQAAFFSVAEQEIFEEESVPFAPKIHEEEPSAHLEEEEDHTAPLEEGVEAAKTEPSVHEEEEPPVTLFRPLQFSTPIKDGRGGNGYGHGNQDGTATLEQAPAAPQGPVIDDATRETFERQVEHSEALKRQIAMLTDKLEATDDMEYEKLLEDIQATQADVDKETADLHGKLFPAPPPPAIEEEISSNESALKKEGDGDNFDDEDYDDSHIIRANRGDYIWTGILLLILIGFTAGVVGWETHLDETYSTFGAVGLACATPCTGNLTSQDYFHEHSHFEDGQFIELIMQLDPYPLDQDMLDTTTKVQIVGVETGQVKKTVYMGPPEAEGPITHVEKIEVDFDHPHEDHIINVTSTAPSVKITYKLQANVLRPLAKYSEIIAALIMIFVYMFILLEVIHRTLVAIFGSMVALLFLFAIHGGETESISTIMLNMEWSTLGLLFGMMLIVGELSHTGIFEWLSVRLLVASKGSYNRLMALLCLLTAVASAFLDNVTTMLLVAPVTIDMCNILNVDPRPYLIGEVILSNVGGTATLIGDPPNIIIGSAFEEIGFVDFIINILPCIFLFCIPVAIGIILYIYRYYMCTTKMPELDKSKLIRTYQIYDEPRLLIAGSVAFFVILIFFLHPVHHKDTAWIALMGAFITMAFTNPHDIQDALRNHVEWDTLLFFAGLFVLVEVCAALGLLAAIGNALSQYIEAQEEDQQLTVAITLVLWVSAITSAFLDNIPYTATMIPVIRILADELPDTLPIETLAWALSFGACLGGNGTLLGASANIVTAGIATNKGFEISFLNFLYPGMVVMVATVAIANLYMLVVYVWV